MFQAKNCISRYRPSNSLLNLLVKYYFVFYLIEFLFCIKFGNIKQIHVSILNWIQKKMNFTRIAKHKVSNCYFSKHYDEKKRQMHKINQIAYPLGNIRSIQLLFLFYKLLVENSHQPNPTYLYLALRWHYIPYEINDYILRYVDIILKKIDTDWK